MKTFAHNKSLLDLAGITDPVKEIRILAPNKKSYYETFFLEVSEDEVANLSHLAQDSSFRKAC